MERAFYNPRMFKFARESLGLDVEKAAKEVRKEFSRLRVSRSIGSDELSAVERGEVDPDYELVFCLCKVYQRDAAFFFLDAPPPDEEPPAFRARAGEMELDYAARRGLLEFERLADWVASLVEAMGIRWTADLPWVSPEIAPQVLAEREAARLGFEEAIRKSWPDRSAAFEWWRRRLESKGVVCVALKLGEKGPRGAALWRQGIPFVLVNHDTTESDAGRLFSSLHEYAHLLVSRADAVRRESLALEKFCERFAARVLLPVGALREAVAARGGPRADWSESRLRELAEDLKVSMAAVAIGLEEAGLAREGFFREMLERWRQRPRTGWGRAAPVKRVERTFRRLGFSIARLMLTAWESGDLEPTALTDLTGARIEKAREYLEHFRERLGGIE